MGERPGRSSGIAGGPIVRRGPGPGGSIPLSGRGVSNEAEGVELTVSVDSGSLVVFAIDDVSHARRA